MDNILLKNGEDYVGEYVSTKSFGDKKVVSHGVSMVDVFDAAKREGVENPVIFYVPEKGMAQIY